MLFSNKRLPLAAAITAFVAATPVAAQQLEEVIVTAQKRAENLQDVPISVSTVGAEKIQDNTIFNFSALADFVPSLHIAEASVNTNIYMRGIGSGNNRGFEQSVGMYLDGVYLGRGRQYRSALMDVERVEVVIGMPEQLMADFNPEALQRAAVRFTADPEQLFAAEWLDYEAEANRDTQTYDVRFTLIEQPPWPVLPGMTTTVLLSLTTTDQATMQVPMSALQSDATGGLFVWVVHPDSAAVMQRPVEVGIPERDSVAILSGLEIGEQVVAAGGAWLYAGIRVRPLSSD